MRAVYSYGVAGLILVAGAAWMATGTFVSGGNGPGNGERAIIPALHADASAGGHHAEGGIDPHLTIAERVAQAGGGAAVLQSVRTETFQVQAFRIEVPLRGRTKAKSMATISPETSGVVTAVNVTKGQTVAVGDVLCTLDQGTRAAGVATAQAALTQAQADFETNKSLRDKGLAPANTANALEAALKAAQSQFDQAQAEFDRTQVKTTVAGVVQDRDVGGSVLGSVTRILHRVVDLAHDPSALLVDHEPVGREFGHAVPRELRHRASDPLAYGLSAIEGAESVFHVDDVLGEHVREGVPIAGTSALDNGVLVTREGIFEFGACPGHERLLG